MAGSGRWRHPKSWSKAKTQLPGKLWWVGEGGDSHMPGKRESSWGWVQLRGRVTECNWAFFEAGMQCFPLCHKKVKQENDEHSNLLLHTFPLSPSRRGIFIEWIISLQPKQPEKKWKLLPVLTVLLLQQKSKSPRNSSVCWSRKLLFWAEI